MRDFRTLPFPRAPLGGKSQSFCGLVTKGWPSNHFQSSSAEGRDVRAVDAALICSKQQIHQIRVGHGQSRVDKSYMRLARCFHANWAVFPAASLMCFPAFAS